MNKTTILLTIAAAAAVLAGCGPTIGDVLYVKDEYARGCDEGNEYGCEIVELRSQSMTDKIATAQQEGTLNSLLADSGGGDGGPEHLNYLKSGWTGIFRTLEGGLELEIQFRRRQIETYQESCDEGDFSACKSVKGAKHRQGLLEWREERKERREQQKEWWASLTPWQKVYHKCRKAFRDAESFTPNLDHELCADTADAEVGDR
ncbi:MAG: hypothetical protein ACR2QC_01735 [Gammaproteobacteria bacterium]